MAFLIDTDILIYSLKDYAVVNENFKKHLNTPKAISIITYGELYFGAKKSKNIEKNTAIATRVSENFEVINVDKTIIECFGELKANLQKTGAIISDFDLIIGATALSFNLTVVTNNDTHFNKIPGLKVVNWTKSN